MEVTYPLWIEKEFESIDFNDLRLTKRFKFILTSFMKNAQSNIASVFENWASIKGCYRFFGNAKTDAKLILSEHIDKTISRIDKEKGVVLILHDTTYFDYKHRHKTSDLDRITKGKLGGNGSSGLLLHNSFAISNSGIPLGLVNQTFIR